MTTTPGPPAIRRRLAGGARRLPPTRSLGDRRARRPAAGQRALHKSRMSPWELTPSAAPRSTTRRTGAPQTGERRTRGRVGRLERGALRERVLRVVLAMLESSGRSDCVATPSGQQRPITGLLGRSSHSVGFPWGNRFPFLSGMNEGWPIGSAARPGEQPPPAETSHEIQRRLSGSPDQHTDLGTSVVPRVIVSART